MKLKGMTGAAKIGAVFALFLFVVTISYLGTTAFAVHTSTAELEPEWSQPGVGNDYTVTITNNGIHTVDEVRIYRNMLYDDFVCDEKTGWEMNFIVAKQACEYVATDVSYHITSGNFDTFTFSATAPAEEPEQCLLEWQFETRDLTDTWFTTYDTTSIDSEPPVTIKTYGIPFKEEGNYHWISTSTPITLQATDMTEECAIGVDKLYWRNTVLDIPDQDCIITCQYESNVEWTEVDGGYAEIYKPEESCHLLEFYAVDLLGNEETINRQCFFVDNTPPEVRKDVMEPKAECGYWGEYFNLPNDHPEVEGLITGLVLGDNPFNHDWYDEQYFSFERRDSSLEWGSGFFEVDDGLPDDPYYAAVHWNAEIWVPEEGDYEFYLKSDDDSWVYIDDTMEADLGGVHAPMETTETVHLTAGWHTIDIYHAERHKVDSWMDFHWITPGIIAECDWLVNHETDIKFSCIDQNPHPSGDEELCFIVSYDQADDGYVTEEYCDKYSGTMEENYCCLPATSDNKFVLNFNEGEDSLHDLEYYCRDAVEKTSEVHTQWYKVDDTAPIIQKEMIGDNHLGQCPPPENPEEPCYVADNGENGVAINVIDGGEICHVDQLNCYYQVWWHTGEENCQGQYVDGRCLVDSNEFSDYAKVIFTEDSTHDLEIYCQDGLGNVIEDTETFLVDSTPPETTKTYGEPNYWSCNEEEPCYPLWITPETPIYLDSEDEKVGVDYIKWRNMVITDPNGWHICEQPGQYCMPGEYGYWPFVDLETSWTEAQGNHTEFTKDGESCHVLEYRAVDIFGNIEDLKYQCFFVDDTEPTINKAVGEPKIACEPNDPNECDYYITKNTEITFTCEDQYPHPVNDVTIYWNTYIWNNGWELLGEFSENSEEVTWTFEGDSKHKVEYWCEDAFEHSTEIYEEIDVVDTQKPEIIKTVVGPRYPEENCPPEEGEDCYIDGITEIHVDAYDPDPHPVNEVVCDWDYEVLDDEKLGNGQSGLTPPFVINFPEESTHELHITCWDALDNTVEDVEIFYVDKTPPGIWKQYDDTYYDGWFYPCEGCEQYWAEWISSATVISAGATDDGPHLSGIKEVKYRTTLKNDEQCRFLEVQEELPSYECTEVEGSGEWTNVDPTEFGEFDFNIPEESCHLIEIMATDNVDKCALHKQWVYVDNTPPTPIKTVGDPKTKWYPTMDDILFYPEIVDRCWNEQEDSIDCWKVTILTPITLGCEDEGDHPVDHETLCYKVELDKEDVTDEYCNTEPEDGWCCGDPAGTEFYFNEETEHELEYYCEDALGNRGDTDEEKFKVEGTSFKIQINKKWNLISTPVVLMNDAMEEIFGDNNPDIKGVYTYDPTLDLCGKDWCMYSPNGIADDDLGFDTMTPGWGYWVMANENTELIIGGTLMSPGKTPPSRILVTGWNLIGYYGPDGLTEYNGPDGNGDPAFCALASLGNDWLDKSFTSLWTYWEPYNTDGDPNTNIWIPLGLMENMDPGAGYWVSTSTGGIYTPSTICNY